MHSKKLITDEVSKIAENDINQTLNVITYLSKKHMIPPLSAIDIIREEKRLVLDREWSGHELAIKASESKKVLEILKNEPLKTQTISELSLNHRVCILRKKYTLEKTNEIQAMYQKDLEKARSLGYNHCHPISYEEALDGNYQAFEHLEHLDMSILMELSRRLHLIPETKKQKRQLTKIINTVFRESDHNSRINGVMEEIAKQFDSEYGLQLSKHL